MTKQYKIYKLIDPRDNSVRYVGVTINSLKVRLVQHTSESKNHIGTHKRYWIRDLLLHNLKPVIELVENCNKDNWKEREIFWISNFDNLTNSNLGGGGIVIKNNSSIRKSAEGHYKPIVQLDRNLKYIREYISIKDAVNNTGISQTNISENLSKRTKTAGNFHFVYKSEYSENYTTDMSKIRGSSIKRIIQIIYKNDVVQVFNTVTECAKFLNVSSGYIISILGGKRKIDKSIKLNHLKSIQDIKI